MWNIPGTVNKNQKPKPKKSKKKNLFKNLVLSIWLVNFGLEFGHPTISLLFQLINRLNEDIILLQQVLDVALQRLNLELDRLLIVRLLELQLLQPILIEQLELVEKALHLHTRALRGPRTAPRRVWHIIHSL